MRSNDDIQVSQILYCNNGEPVEVINLTDKSITVAYHDQLHTRPISIIGDKLHVELSSAKLSFSQKQHEPIKDVINSKTEESNTTNKTDKETHCINSIDTPASCFQCMLQARDDCFGKLEICNMFQRKPDITREERKNWPSYGDATAFRLGEHRNH